MIEQIIEKLKNSNVIIFVNNKDENIVKQCAESVFDSIEKFIKTRLTVYEVITTYNTFICVRKVINNPVVMKNAGYEMIFINVD